MLRQQNESDHSFSEYKRANLLFCRQCGKTIKVFAKTKYKCLKCRKVVHEKCLKKVSKSCGTLYDEKISQLGEISLKVVNRYSSSGNSHLGILVMEAQNVPAINQTGLYDSFVKVRCKSSSTTAPVFYQSKTLHRTRNLIWNELFEIEVQPNATSGTVTLELHQCRSRNTSQLTGCMTFTFKELINTTETRSLWFKVLPPTMGFMSNVRMDPEPASQIAPLINKLLMSSLKKGQKEQKKHVSFKRDDKYPKLEDFKLLKLIGCGGFSKVFESECMKKETLSGFFALKIIRKDVYYDKNQITALRNEKNILSMQESHPFILLAHSCFQTREYVCFVFEFMEGGDLEFHLNTLKKLNNSATMFYVCEVVEALIFLHMHDIIYRDIKPENILLQHSGHIKLTDFSVSKTYIGVNQRTYTFCGTLEYLPPELLFEKGISFESDWWSLGVFMFFILTGDYPFKGQKEEMLLDNIKYGKLIIPLYVKENTRLFITSLLNKDPARRIGHGIKGDMYLRSHAYFSEIDWNVVRKQNLTPPIVPNIEFPGSAENFDKEFTQTVINFTPPNEEILDAISDEEFGDMDFSH